MVDTRLQSKRSISLGFEAQEGQHHPRQALGQCDWFLPLLGWISLYVGCSWCAKYGRYPDPCSSATRPVTIRLALLPSLPSIQVSDKIHAMALRGARALPRVQERIFFFFFPFSLLRGIRRWFPGTCESCVVPEPSFSHSGSGGLITSMRIMYSPAPSPTAHESYC